MSCLRVVSCLCYVLVYSSELFTLSLGLHVEIFGNLTDVVHQSLNVVQVSLSLLDDIIHIVALSDQLQLLLFLLLNQRILVLGIYST